MPTRRSPRGRGTRRRHINEAAIAAWRECDYLALHRALSLHPGAPSPLPSTVTPLGVDADAEPPAQDGSGWARGWAAAANLQRQLIAIAGFPDCRVAYEENLRRAEEMAAYYRSILEDPARGDVATKLKDLDDALAEVAWRQELMASPPKATLVEAGDPCKAKDRRSSP